MREMQCQMQTSIIDHIRQHSLTYKGADEDIFYEIVLNFNDVSHVSPNLNGVVVSHENCIVMNVENQT
jgi:hypothetical protein